MRAPHEALGALARAALDDLDEALHALDLLLVGDAVLQRRRLGAAAGGEDEGEGAVVADLLGHLERLAEVGLRLAREADDDVRGERHVRDVLADQRDAVEVALARVGAPHGLEDAARAGLQRQVDVLADRRELGVGADHVLAHVLRVRAGVADARDAVDRVDRGEQVGERRPLRAQVAPVGVHVLAQQRDLAHAVGGEALGLAHELGRTGGRPRGRAWRARCSRSSGSCSRRRSASRPGARAPAASAGRR